MYIMGLHYVTVQKFCITEFLNDLSLEVFFKNGVYKDFANSQENNCA